MRKTIMAVAPDVELIWIKQASQSITVTEPLISGRPLPLQPARPEPCEAEAR